MEAVKDNKEPPENYWKDYEADTVELDRPSRNLPAPKRLINGINIKDLCDSKEVMFEISDDCNEGFDTDEEIADDIVYCDTKSMRENRGAPRLNRSFKDIAMKMSDLTENGFVKKQVITCGVGKPVPANAYVTVHYNLYKESSELPFDSTYLRNRPEKFRLDQGETILGLDFAIKSMKKRENSMFFIKWQYAFGALGCPDRIEEKCDIVADITLMNFVEFDIEYDLLSHSEINKLDFNKSICHVKKLLCNGSDEFMKGDARSAVCSYRKALKILRNLRLSDEEEEKEMLKQKLKCLVNLAVCYNKQAKFEQACLFCQEALSIDPSSVKAHFHYGRAAIALSNFSSAESHLRRANALKPNDKDINLEIKRLNDKKMLFDLKDKLFWKKAFEGEKKDQPREEKPCALETFEKILITSLEDCLQEKKCHVVSRPLNDEELKICHKISAQMRFQFEDHKSYYVFKNDSEHPK